MTRKKAIIYGVCTLLVVIVVGLVLFLGKRGSASDPKLFAKRTMNVFDSLKAGDYENAMRDFNSQCRAQISPQQYGKLFEKMTKDFGPLQSYHIMSAQDIKNHRFYKVEVMCIFERKKMAGLVMFDNASKEIFQCGFFEIDGVDQ